MAVSQHICARCGAQFSGRATKYCSAACRAKAKTAANGARRAASAGRVYVPRTFAGPGGAPVTLTLHTCRVCGIGFYPKRTDRTQCCGRECGLLWGSTKTAAKLNGGRVSVRKQMKGRAAKEASKQLAAKPFLATCWECGVTFDRRTGGATCHCCSAACQSARDKAETARKRKLPSYRAAKRAGKAARKAMQRGAAGADPIDPIKVCERDGWKCGLCGRKTPKRLRGTYDDRAPEVDHILPVSLGGKHVWANVQCACRACNLAKGARPMGQLMLFPVAA
jgi:5-methylcytosine-specific restriction endonuclease McrA